jgi:ferredoxin
MSTIKVHVDLDLCQTHGECVFAAPGVFELDDDDVLHWKEEVDESSRADVEEAANVCPMMAIHIEG